MAKNKNLIFGIRAVIEAINAGKDIDKVMIQKGANGQLIKELHQTIRKHSIPFQYLPAIKFKRWEAKNHQGVIAMLSEITYYDIENILPMIYEEGKSPYILILDQVSDVRNFGAIARTAECAGVHAIIVPQKGSAAINADAIKTSAGALYKIPVCRVVNLSETVELLKNNGLQIIAAGEKHTTSYYDVNYNNPTAIIMGAEDVGVSKSLLLLADKTVNIPMLGSIESLNVSVATGIILFEGLKQKSIL